MSVRQSLILAIVLLLLANCTRPSLSGISVTCPPELVEGESVSLGVSVTNNSDHLSEFTVVVSRVNYLINFSAKPEKVCVEQFELTTDESDDMVCTIDELSSANLIRVDVTSADGKFTYTCPTP
jgi:hypothetical protein